MKSKVRLLLPLLLAILPTRADALQPAPVFGQDSAPVWEGQQFVQADQTGRIFFFRGDTFEVYPVAKSGSFGKAIRFETTSATNGASSRRCLRRRSGFRGLPLPKIKAPANVG